MRLSRCCAIALLCVAAWGTLTRADGPPRSVAPLAPVAPLGPAPEGQLKFRAFGGADGLRNLVILSFAQDRDGFLWIATDDGVYRFDGERFTHFSVDEGLTSSLTLVVAAAPDGNVCAGGPDGLACWDGTRFVRATAPGLPAIPVLAMATYAGKLWIGTDGAGLYVRDAVSFRPAPGWPGAGGMKVRALYVDAAGLVVGNGANVELSTGDGVWRDLGDVGLGRDRVEGVLRDRAGALWIRTATHMWLLAVGATRAFDLQQGLPTGYDTTGIIGMAIGPRGDVLIATDDGITSREGDHWRIIGHAAGLPKATVRGLFVDRDGTIWVSSAGLFQIRGRGLIERYDVASGLPGDVVWTYVRDRQGALLAGTNRCLARAAADRWTCIPGTEGRTVRNVVFPPQGGMFVGGLPSDLLYLDDAGHATSIGDADQSDHKILALALGPEGDLWSGTKAGLYRLRGARPGPLEQVLLPGAPPDAGVASILVVDGKLWVAAAPGGVFVLDRGAWHRFDVADGFQTRSAEYLLARADGRLCVTYSEAIGLSCFRYDGHGVTNLQHIGPAQGLTTGMVYFLGEDRARRLWVGTGDGVDVVTPLDGTPGRDGALSIDHFDESDGLAGNDSSAKTFMLDADGSLWLGATGGGTHVFAQHYAGPPGAPRTAFLDGRLGDRSIVGRAPVLEVPHDRSALTVELAAGSLLDMKRVEYQVRLSPLESEWSTSHQRQARYPSLPPGSYRFEARARIDTGRWGEASELRFTVLPAWWQRGWFFALIAIGGAAAIGGGFTWRQRAVLRRRTRLLYAQADASFRAVIDLMPDLISVHRDHKVIYLNRASRRMLGERAATEVQPDIIHPDDRARSEALLLRVDALEAEQVSEVIELRMRSADGSWRSCEVSAVRVEIGGAATVVASGRDVTERKRMRAKLMVSDRMASLGTLAAGIAHEINNPLAYVTGNLEVMAEAIQARGASAPDRGELSAAITEARDGAERVRKIVQGLRSFSRSEEEQRVALALPAVLEAAIRLTANEVRHRAQLVRELGPTPLVVADDGRLTQVFINLLINAAHAIPEGHSDANRITVRTRTDDHGRAVIEIEDTGGGIAPDLQSRVFDPFFTTKDVGEGTGLGLSICHGIVSGLGGQISIESAPTRGTVVRVVLPPPVAAALPAPVPISAPASEAVLARRLRVMLVDDEPMVAQTIERLLRRDYDITIASCGRDALAHVVEGVKFDAIVSDVMMPNMTGIELLEELRRTAPEQAARVIFLSGGAFTAQSRERLEALGAPQLEKPVSAKELRACVQRIASEASAAGRASAG